MVYENDIPYKLISEGNCTGYIYQPNKPLRLLNKINSGETLCLVSLAK